MWSPAGWQSSLAAFAALLSTPWRVVSTSCVTASAGLRVNHAQVLGTHNSYKLKPENGIAEFDYEHEPLGDQLDHGVRGFEFDVYLDTATNELTVMHVPFWDYKSTCATLPECLNEIAVWSNANPDHFPLHIRVAFIAALVAEDGEDPAVCTAEDVATAVACVSSNCIGMNIETATSTCGFACLGVVLPLAGGPCEPVGQCMLEGSFAGNTYTTITNEYIDAALSACLQVQSTGVSRVYPDAMEASQMETVFASLEAALDGAFPVAKRIVPADVTLNGGTSEYVWPEVEESRGKVWFYVTGPLSEEDAGSFDYFLQGKHSQITHKDDPEDVEVSSRQMVRTRVDEGLVFDTARQATGKSSGANILSTDFPVEAAWSTWDSITQDDALANTQFFIEGGAPVACNSVTLPDGVECTSEMLEYLQCTPASTATTATVTSLTTTLTSMTTTVTSVTSTVTSVTTTMTTMTTTVTSATTTVTTMTTTVTSATTTMTSMTTTMTTRTTTVTSVTTSVTSVTTTVTSVTTTVTSLTGTTKAQEQLVVTSVTTTVTSVTATMTSITSTVTSMTSTVTSVTSTATSVTTTTSATSTPTLSTTKEQQQPLVTTTMTSVTSTVTSVTSTVTSVTTTTSSSTTKAEEQLLLDGDFAEVCGTEVTKKSFLEECTADLAPVDCTECLPGSLIVVVEAANPSDLEAAVMEVQSNGLDLPSFDSMIVVTTTATATIVTSVTATTTTTITTATQDADASAAAAVQLVAASFISLLALAWAC